MVVKVVHLPLNQNHHYLPEEETTTGRNIKIQRHSQEENYSSVLWYYLKSLWFDCDSIRYYTVKSGLLNNFVSSLVRALTQKVMTSN